MIWVVLVNQTMQKIPYLIVILLLLLGLMLDTSAVSAQASSATGVVAAVNDFRASNGLPHLQIDPILMAVAQAHSDYQAATGTITHTGSGGSRPKDRAAAAGFGGGATIFISENIAGGINLTIQDAIYQYWQDQLHLSTMLNPASVYIGAGVAVNGDYVYYTVDVGYYSGAPAAGSTVHPPQGNGDDQPTALAYDPFIVSTPREDGAIIHVVGYGQSLIGIAKTYEVELDDILQLNGLNMSAIIYPGDKLIIKTPDAVLDALTLTPSPSETVPAASPTNTPTARVEVVKNSPTPRSTFTPVPTESPTPTAIQPPISTERQQLVIGVIIMALLVFLGVVASSFLSRTKEGH